MAPRLEAKGGGVKPRLLDLFCGAGGAAMGYHRAGFEVVGVDFAPQPRYPFEFWQDDALRILQVQLHNGNTDGFNGHWGFDAIHASPPCQAYTAYKRRGGGVGDGYGDLIAETRELLWKTGLPWVIENVGGAPLRSPLMLCGSMFDPPLDVQRHRYFESDWPIDDPPWPCRHGVWAARFPAATNRRENSRRTVEVGVWRIPLETQKQAMGVDWDVTLEELSEMVPPAYTELIGAQLLAHLETPANNASPTAA
jgi:DNA (cytosine-5)-methyltransferase 1